MTEQNPSGGRNRLPDPLPHYPPHFLHLVPLGDVILSVRRYKTLYIVTAVHNIALRHLTVICPHITQFRIPARHSVDGTAIRIPAKAAFDSSNKVLNSPDFTSGTEQCARDGSNWHSSTKFDTVPPNKHTFHYESVEITNKMQPCNITYYSNVY